MYQWIQCFFLLPIFCFAENIFSYLDVFQEKLTRIEVEEKIQRFLQKDSHISQYFLLTDEALTLYDFPEEHSERKVEYTLKLAKQSQKIISDTKRNHLFLGVRIAIDPGHLGGIYAHLEQRYIDISPSFERTNNIRFDEGTLSFLTAIYLKILLEKEGAIVFITRAEIGQSVYPDDFFEWLKKNPKHWSGEISLKELFKKYYNPLDLHERAKKINDFHPDFTIVIHYNSHHVEEAFSSNHCVTAANYNLVFIPGGFFRTELGDAESRLEFIRLIATDDIYHSLELSRCVLNKFTEKLEIPVVTKSDGAFYLDRACIKVEEGVYARNLALTRLIHGPVCYGETLIQNNIDECLNLSRSDFFIHGKSCSSRIKQVAEAYFEGIKEYLLKQNGLSSEKPQDKINCDGENNT